MKTALVIFGLLAVVSAISMEGRFSAWMRENNKVYHSQAERTYRFGIFAANARYIDQFNAEGHSWTMATNKFADMTEEEFAAEWLMPERARDVDANIDVRAGSSDVTGDVDWLAAGYVTDIKNQASCGSCWAFGTVAGIEACNVFAGYELTSYSEQQLVSCVPNTTEYACAGCDGGWMTGAMQWMIDNNVGLETYDEYPYTSSDGTVAECAEDSSKYHVYITDYETSKTETALQSELLKRPIIIAMNALKLSWYSGGVYCPDTCTSLIIDHALLVVAMNSTENSYTIKNSWGADWGEAGYFRMCGGNNECGISLDACWPTDCYQ